MHFQDSKQILIYCELNSKKSQACYEDKLNKVISNYTKEFGPISNQESSELRRTYSYIEVKSRVNSIIAQISAKTIKNMNDIVKVRKDFCKKNSKNYLSKCLVQYEEKDTFTVLNKFHRKFKMNGHEYLYLKGKIKTQLNHKFKEAERSLNRSSVRSSVRSI